MVFPYTVTIANRDGAVPPTMRPGVRFTNRAFKEVPVKHESPLSNRVAVFCQRGIRQRAIDGVGVNRPNNRLLDVIEGHFEPA